MGLFDAQGRLAAKHPWAAIAIIIALTGIFASGFFIDSGPAGDQTAAFLPADSELGRAQAKIAEDFANESTAMAVQVIFRGDTGDVITPQGLQAMLDSLDRATADPVVAPHVMPERGTSAAHVLLAVLQETSFANVDQQQVDDAFARLGPQVQGLVACGQDACLTEDIHAALAIITLDTASGSEQALVDAQLAIETALDGFAWGDVEGRSFSGAKLNQESNEAQGASTSLLMGLALAIILGLLALFYRTASDVALSIGGLVLTLVWVFGIQGILGPGLLDIIGADSPLAMMIPILLIGLTVDYALQFTGRYREELGAGRGVRPAIHAAVRHSGMPLLLAAGTTAISFLTNLSSGLPPMQDFGIIAAVGVSMGWFVMITFVPAVRTLLDDARASKGRPVQARHMADAVPGVGAAIARMSQAITRHPMSFLGTAGVISVAAFIAAANVSTTFSQTDFLPENTESFEDLVFLQEAFSGGGATATILIEGELTDTDTLRDLVNIEMLLADPATRPDGVTGPVQASFLTLAGDWAVHNPDLPGDKYDPDMADLLLALDRFFPPAEALEAVFDELRSVDPDGFAQVVALRDGPDRTILTFPVVAGDADATRTLVSELHAAWGGDEQQFFVTGSEVLQVTVLEEMTSSQIQSVAITIAAALLLLVVFFWATERKPGLGVITVLPIGLVVGWVLGSMWLLGISYNVMTALITALTIGVGVDYTIHITHRFLEEYRERGDIGAAVGESLRTTGGALLGSAMTTALGFGVLLFSPLAPMQQFGGLTALTIVFSLVASFVVLPPMLVLWALYHEWRKGEMLRRAGIVEFAPSTKSEDWVLGGVRGAGRVVRCPECTNETYLPDAMTHLRCPNYWCGFAGANPTVRR